VSTIQEQISDKFLTKLAGSEHIDEVKLEKLRVLLLSADKKKVKADDFVQIFSLPPGGDIK
jgi:hypothetical protein